MKTISAFWADEHARFLLACDLLTLLLAYAGISAIRAFEAAGALA